MMMDNMLTTFHTLVADDPHAPRNFREVFKEELFRLSLIQVSLSENRTCDLSTSGEVEGVLYH